MQYIKFQEKWHALLCMSFFLCTIPFNIFVILLSTRFLLQDFDTSMHLIAPHDKSKLNKYQQEIEKSAFASIKDRVKFYDYDTIGMESIIEFEFSRRVWKINISKVHHILTSKSVSLTSTNRW